MLRSLPQKILAALRADPVLAASLALALLSCFFCPPSPGYLSYIDFDTLILLFCLMAVMEGLRAQGVFPWVCGRLLGHVRSGRGIVFTLVFLCFVSSMFITNDVALITFVPLGILVLSMAGLSDRLCYTVTLMTIAANLGSMFTPIGNPQNLYLFSLSGLGLGSFLLLTLPYTLAAAGLLTAFIFFGYRRQKGGAGAPSVRPPLPANRGHVGLLLALFALCVATVAGVIPHPALLAVVALTLLFTDRKALAGVDYPLLLTFVFFFIFVGNAKQLSGLHTLLLTLLQGHERLLGVLASQIISNVPAAMLLSGYSGDLKELIVGTNIGGLGTLIASMASLISYKQVAGRYPALKRQYLATFTLCNLVFLVPLYFL